MRGGQGDNGGGVINIEFGGRPEFAGPGGLGGQVTGTANPSIGDVLSVVVGTMGPTYGANPSASGPGAQNPGAGLGGIGGNDPAVIEGYPGGGGGGASALWNLPAGQSVATLLAIAGGGGGGGAGEASTPNLGGSGGYGGTNPSAGLTGTLNNGGLLFSPGVGGGPASLTAGGTAGPAANQGGNAGSNGGAGANGGNGGPGFTVGDTGGGGGGGGGWFAGAGGGGGGAVSAGGGGGGGISYAPGAATSVFRDNAVAGVGLIVVTYLTAPVVAVAAPTGTVTDTSEPLIGFTYTSAESAPMQSYRIVVFSEPGTGWPAGLDGTGNYTGSVIPLVPVYDSGVVYAANPPLTPASSPLPNGDLRAYVQATDSAGADSLPSAWADTEWTQNAPGPNAPTVVLNPTPTHARVGFTVTPAPGLTTTSITIQRSLDGGDTWQSVAGGTAIPVSGVTTFRDIGAPREVPIEYQVIPIHTSAAGVNLLGAAWTGSTTLLSDSNTWLMCSGNHLLNSVQDYQGPNISTNRHTDEVAYYPEGRTTAVVNVGTIHADTFTSGIASQPITFIFANDTQWLNFLAAWQTQTPLLLKTVYGDIGGLEQFWVMIGEDAGIVRQGGASRMGSGVNGRGPQIRMLSVNLYVVSEPT